MFDKYIDRIKTRYENRLTKYGYDIKTMASGNEARRNLRYKILSEVGDLNNCSLLDLGCGFSDFYDYLIGKGIKGLHYVGYDIVPGIAHIAKSRHPHLEIRECNVFHDEFPHFDYIVSSSAFNLKFEDDNYSIVNNLLGIIFKHATKGVSIDFMSEYVDYKGSDEIFYYKPETVFSMAKQLSNRVCLRHDYNLFEFCIYIYKSFSGWAPNSKQPTD